MTTTRSDAPSAGKAAFDPRLRRLAIVVFTGAIMTIVDSTIVNVAINTVGRDLHTSLSTVQWVLTAYTLALSVTIPLSGWAVERFGGRNAWITSLMLFIGGSVLCGIAWNITALIVFRALQGLGGGLLMPVGQTMLAAEAGPSRMGRVMSVISVPAMLAPVAGPVLGGLIVDHLIWRWMFYVNIPICALALLLALRWLPRDDDRPAAGRLDVLGLALISPGLAALVYGLSGVGNGAGPASARVLGTVGAGGLLLTAFTVHALRTSGTPLLDVRLFRHRAFSAGVAALCVYSGAMFGLTVLLPLYSQIARGEDPIDAGFMIAPFGLGAMITMLLGGRIADRRGPRGVGITGIAVVAVSSLVFTQLAADTGRVPLLDAAFVVGLGHGLLVSPLMAAVYQSLPRASVATATPTANILVRAGGSFGTAFLAVVLQINIRAEIPGASGRLDDTAAFRAPHAVEGLVRAFGNSFWWAAGLAAMALLPALLLPRHTAES
jgi:EmrB/QacA subfamily drug resistance transporter